MEFIPIHEMEETLNAWKEKKKLRKKKLKRKK
jgi:hypothetical protein